MRTLEEFCKMHPSMSWVTVSEHELEVLLGTLALLGAKARPGSVPSITHWGMRDSRGGWDHTIVLVDEHPAVHVARLTKLIGSLNRRG